MKITRESLADGSLRDLRLRYAAAHPDWPWRNEEQMAQSMEEMLRTHHPGADLYVFGYGSLIWNPAFEFIEQRCALLRGWHRCFCLQLYMGRGSPQTPGLMLALDRGGSCRGVVFRIEAAKIREELWLLWQREMFGGAYDARWVTLESAGVKIRALTFVINRAHPRYTRAYSVAQTAAIIATAAGELGSCREYLENTVAHLQALGVRDAALARIIAALPKG